MAALLKTPSNRRTLHLTGDGFARLGSIAIHHNLPGWHSLVRSIAKGSLLVINPARTATKERISRK